MTSGPSHHGHTVKCDVADGEVVAVAGDAEFADVADPARDLFALRAAFVEVVIARAENDPRHARQQRQVFFHHHDLRAEIDERSDVERVTGENDDVELGSCRQQPVELRQ